MLHITATAQCFALVMGFLTSVLPVVVRWIWANGFTVLLSSFYGLSSAYVKKFIDGWQTLDGMQQILASLLGQMSSVWILYTATCFVVVLDLIEGRFYRVMPQKAPTGDLPEASSTRAITSV